jgi:predicted phosphohydrolase
MVLGNHEFWDTSVKEVFKVKEKIRKSIQNVHILENESIFLDGGRKLHGCTLWFSDNPMNALNKKRMGDFEYIKGFEPWVYNQNKASLKYLRDNVKEGDIVMTHHLPTFEAVSPKWRNDALTNFFYTEVPFETLTKPSLWVFGHTHDSVDFTIENTRFLCNPYGYLFNRNKEYQRITMDI